MGILYEINPPKLSADESESASFERMHNLARKLSPILGVCDGTLITDSVLGRPRMNPIEMAKIIQELHPNLETIVSMRTSDRNASQAAEFAASAADSKISGILVVKGDPGNSGDSGLVPSAAAAMMRDTIRTYLSVQSRPDFSKMKKKIGSKPAGFFTQVIGTIGQIRHICDELKPYGFRTIPCIMVPSEKNAGSAKFLGLDWSSYSENTAEFVKSVCNVAGDVLLTSPSDMQASSELLSRL